jgi:hypothetical protein
MLNVLLGTQATVTPSNLSEIRSLHPYSIQLNNLRIYEDWESFRQNAGLVADMRPLVILYFEPDSSDVSLSYFCEWAAINIPADTFQIAQEPDILNGMDGYYGGWGIENIGLYIHQFNICGIEIKEHSDALISIGISTSCEWREWLDELMTRNVYNLDVIGIHHYNSYHWYEYNPEDLRSNIQFAKQYGLPVWVSEMGYRCSTCDASNIGDFYIQQAQFVEKAIPDAFRFGAQRVYYYGYNPGWENVDLEDNPFAIQAFKNLIR